MKFLEKSRSIRRLWLFLFCLVLLVPVRIKASEITPEKKDDYRIIIEAEVLEKDDCQYIKYEDDNYYVLYFSDWSEAQNCYWKYRKSTRSDADFISKAHICATGVENYKYLSWGTEKIGCGSISKGLLQKYENLNNLPEITVGIIDSGIDYNHPLFVDRSISAKYDYVQNDGDAMDVLGHGTHVAGIIVDSTLPNVKINAYRVANEKGEAYIDDIVMGIHQAIDDHVDIINMSLGAELQKGSLEEKILKEALEEAIKKDIVIVTAAGNGDEDGIGIDVVEVGNIWPACYPPAITVSAIDENNQPAVFSNYGKAIDLCAPGVEINSSYLKSRFKTMSGTSMACPFITGAAALLLTDDPSMTYMQVTEGLENIAIDLGEEGVDIYFGYGLIDLEKWKIHDSKAHAMETEKDAITLSDVEVTTISNTAKGVRISWKQSENAQGYYICRKNAKGKYKQLKVVSRTARLTYVDESVRNGLTYQYKVVPYYEKIVGACKNTVRIARLTPVKCAALQNTISKGIKVSVSQNKKASGYQIQYSNSKSFGKKVTMNLNGNKTLLKNIKNLKKGKKYFVRVRCFYKNGTIKSYSSWSTIKKVSIKK